MLFTPFCIIPQLVWAPKAAALMLELIKGRKFYLYYPPVIDHLEKKQEGVIQGYPLILRAVRETV